MDNNDYRYEQVCAYLSRRKNLPVQAFINSIAFPKTLEDVLFFMREIHHFNLEEILSVSQTVWSVPRWCKKGDIVLFMHTVTSDQTIRRLRVALRKTRANYTDSEVMYIEDGLDRGQRLYDEYGGKIVAIGIVTGNIIKHHGDNHSYAEISRVFPLNRPIDYCEFKKIQKLSTAGAITPVYGEKYEYIKSLIAQDTQLPSLIAKSKSEPIRETMVNKNNWIEVAQNYRFHYTLESQFRAAFVDYLLKALADKHKIYEECFTVKSTGEKGFIDNVIPFAGSYLPVEVKLDVNLEADLNGQVRKYCDVDSLLLDKTKDLYAPLSEIYPGRVLIVDTFRVYMYYYEEDEYQEIFDLWDLLDIADVEKLRKIILEKLGQIIELPDISLEQRIRSNNMARILCDGTYLSSNARERINLPDVYERNACLDGERYYRREQYEWDRYAVNNPDADETLARISTIENEIRSNE